MNYPTVKFPNDTAHMLFDLGYTYGMLMRTLIVLERALTNIQDEHTEAEIRDLVEEIKSLDQGRLQQIDALYANADNSMELLNKIVAAQDAQ